ncbi:phosphate transporter [Auriscalpium vulgare]|uniref:Phosphate transporter n=1 Tax=Auriscalpium vulgare TaxID=40419 RepID=A0ACB8RWQ2_9AGAM|nr:phosphate transporter [Auriscalpium vulgare]
MLPQADGHPLPVSDSPSSHSLPALPPISSDVHAENEHRLAILAELDDAPFSPFFVKVAAVAGVGFFTDAYDIFAINIASTMLGYVYSANHTKLTSNQDLAVKVATPVGTLIGQLLFGWLADVIGRKRMYGIELVIIIFATFAQTLSSQGPTVNIIGVLVVWRFLMGVGIGGDYPLSAVIPSEFAAKHSRGRLMTSVFACQGWGNLAAALVSLAVVSAFKSSILHDQQADQPVYRHVDFCWRILIGLGCIPGVIAVYFRLTIPETPRFTMDVERNVRQATDDITSVLIDGTYWVDHEAAVRRVGAPRASKRDFIGYFGQRKNLKILIGCAYSWFAVDMVYYGLGLNSPIILQGIGFAGLNSTTSVQNGAFAGSYNVDRDAYGSLHRISVGNIILSVAGLIPGYWVSFLFIDSWGRRPIQLLGFSMLTVILIIMGFGYDAMKNHANGALVFLFCLANFFQNFGPNLTTFVIPGEVFPTRYRSTAHGICAACGKLGAIVSQVGFAHLQNIGGDDHFLKHIFEIFALFSLTGVFSTMLLPETKLRTLEDLSNEKQDDFIQGRP